MSQVVIFRTGTEDYAIPMQYVVSIEKIDGLSPIPQMPDYVKGVIEIREQIIPVLDLEFIFYHRFMNFDESSRLIVIQIEGMLVGILVNEAKEIIEIPSEKIKRIGLIVTAKTGYLSGVASLNGRLVAVMNPNNLVNSLKGINMVRDFLDDLR
jgi:purine-binding chemotaxis protein CheW